MIEAVVLGIVLGVVAGVIPGIGSFVCLLLVWPLLATFSIYELLMLYVSMAAISQYIGSIPAIIYGIPGEGSSYPAVAESRHLTTQEKVSHAISGSAFGSMFGGIVVVLLCYFLAEYVQLLKHFYSTKLFVFLLLFVLSLMVFTISNHKIVNILFILVGLFLGVIGYNPYLDFKFLTFNSFDLWGGLPLPVVLICLFAIPQITYYLDDSVNKEKERLYSIAKLYILNPIGLVGSTLVGFIGGLVPGLTTVFSSTFAYGLSKFFTSDPVDRIVVSETANNAGAFSQLLPLLLFGIPILSSEALLLFFMEQKGYSVESFSFITIIPTLAITLMAVNVVGFLLAWPLSRHVKLFYSIDIKKIMMFILICLFGVVIYTGYINYSVYYYLFCFFVLAPIGVLLRKYNTLPLVFTFLIHDKLLEGLFRFFQLV